jgi:type I restriction enzyme S subunit
MAAKSASPASAQILSEIGLLDLPDDWGIVRIEDLLSRDRGISVGVMYPGDHYPHGIPLIEAGDLAGSRINSSPAYRISPEKHSEYRRTELAGGELLISLVGDVGRCAIVPSSMAGWNAARAVAVLRFQSESEANFVRACLLSPPFQHLMRAWSTTTVQATLNLKEIRQIPLPWPPSSMRSTIAHILGTLDHKIELNRRRNQTLEAMARALFRDWFVDFGPVRAKMEGHEPYLPADIWQQFPDRLDDQGKPEGWETKRVSDYLSLAYGKSLPAGKRHPGGIPVYGSGGITGFHNVALVHEPAVIIGRKGTVGSLYWEDRPCFPIDTVFFVEPAAPLPFCHYLLESLPLRDMNTDAAVPGLNRENVYRLEVAGPPTALIAAFDKTASRFRETIAAVSGESETLIQLRDTLLPKLISGELRIANAEKFMEKSL